MSNEIQPTPCLIPECNKPAKWKGLCGSCHHMANAEIAKGQLTWESLEAMGLCKLEEKPFIKALKAKLAEVQQ